MFMHTMRRLAPATVALMISMPSLSSAQTTTAPGDISSRIASWDPVGSSYLYAPSACRWQLGCGQKLGLSVGQSGSQGPRGVAL
jgi:hypothetical protein